MRPAFSGLSPTSLLVGRTRRSPQPTASGTYLRLPTEHNTGGRLNFCLETRRSSGRSIAQREDRVVTLPGLVPPTGPLFTQVLRQNWPRLRDDGCKDRLIRGSAQRVPLTFISHYCRGRRLAAIARKRR